MAIFFPCWKSLRRCMHSKWYSPKAWVINEIWRQLNWIFIEMWLEQGNRALAESKEGCLLNWSIFLEPTINLKALKLNHSVWITINMTSAVTVRACFIPHQGNDSFVRQWLAIFIDLKQTTSSLPTCNEMTRLSKQTHTSNLISSKKYGWTCTHTKKNTRVSN